VERVAQLRTLCADLKKSPMWAHTGKLVGNSIQSAQVRNAKYLKTRAWNRGMRAPGAMSWES